MKKLYSDINKVGWQFDNTYTKLPDNMFSNLGPIPVKAPEVVIFNHFLYFDGFFGFDRKSKIC